jgi:uncharacterized membrane protein
VTVLAVLLLSWAAFRTAGICGIAALETWRSSGRWALAVILFVTASAHFTAMRHDLVKMQPEWIPKPMLVIYVTGLLEVAGGGHRAILT